MRYLIQAIAGLALAMTGLQAQALIINVSPGDCNTTYTCWTYDENGGYPLDAKNPDATDVTAIVGLTVEEYYKADVGDTSNPATTEKGDFAGSYSTVFDNDPLDPADATISYDGSTSIKCPECYLLVKDGNSDPRWYLFDIGTWDGVMDIVMTGFWPGSGAISHVSIFGKEGQVPEPGPLALLAIGLLAVGMRQLKKA